MKRVEDKKTLYLRPLEIDRRYLLKLSSTLVIYYRVLVKFGWMGSFRFKPWIYLFNPFTSFGLFKRQKPFPLLNTSM